MSLYGVTFAQKLLQHGEFQQALEAATKHKAQDPSDPEPWYDRARALAGLGHYEDAVAEFLRALELDREAQVLPDGDVDDHLFSTLLAWAQGLAEGRAEEKVAILGRYRAALPGGTHAAEIDEWAQRFRGLLKTTWVKPRE